MSLSRRLVPLARGAAIYLGIVLATLVLLDVALMATGLFPPPARYGHPTLGWVSAEPTGHIERRPCLDALSGETFVVERNEAGLRTAYSAEALRERDDWLEIAATGDSHTDLCLDNAQVHFGVLETQLRADGVEAAVFSYGAGRYSPLQEYLAVAEPMQEYDADVLVMNLYTGNDFYDILRVDDRPHFVETAAGYEIAPPTWYEYDAPGERKRSRVLFALGAVADRLGVGNVWVRLRYLRAVSAEQGSGIGAVVGYVNDLRNATAPEVGYPGAYAAQILNQLLFFHRFPSSRNESMSRVRALMDMVRAQHPGVLFVMSPIPSYLLVQEQPVDPPLLGVFERIPLSYDEAVRMEGELYDGLREEATDAGWVFVDNLAVLRELRGGERLFNDLDYHITAPANRAIGVAQAAAILSAREVGAASR